MVVGLNPLSSFVTSILFPAALRSGHRHLERAVGVEPTTASLEGWDSIAELRPPLSQSEHFGRQEKYERWLPVEQALLGGQARIRTLEADGNRFTVCPLWPLGYLPEISSAKLRRGPRFASRRWEK